MSSDNKAVEQKKKPLNFSFSSHAIAGGVSAVFSATFTCPFEVVKTRQQSSLFRNSKIIVNGNRASVVNAVIKPFKETGIIMRDVYRKEGTRALFKGLGPNLLGIIPMRAIHFGVYGYGKQKLIEMNHGVERPWIHMLSAFSAGFCSSTFTNPLWLVKTRMQLESKKFSPDGKLLPPKYKNALQCFKTVYKEEGIKAFGKGLAASYIGLTETTIQFATYEHFKKVVHQYREKKNVQHSPRVQKIFDWADDFACAATAKLIASGITYPHEVLRTRMREIPESGVSPYQGLIQSAKLIVKEEGVGALYRGLGTHLIRVVPNAAILFTVYEIVLYGHKKYIGDKEKKEEEN